MKKYRVPIILFISAFICYFFFGTRFTFHPIWALDYFNPLAASLRQGYVSIAPTGNNYDLIHFNNKWYAPWGILAALFLIPLQIIKGQYIPTIYLASIFSALDVVIAYLVLRRLKKEFIPGMTDSFIWISLILFAFGTTHFYVGTLGSSWHVDQMVSMFFGNLGIYLIFKKHRSVQDYLQASLAISVCFIGRATLVLLGTIPLLFFLFDVCTKKNKQLVRILPLIAIIPVFFLILFFAYNYVRFKKPLEYGYQFINEAPKLETVRITNGIFSIKNLPINLWYMLMELPRFSLNNGIKFDFNLMGNSIFFLTPAFLPAILTLSAFYVKRRYKSIVPVAILWIAMILVMMPSFLVYSTGWMQFGYRYSLDITLLLIMLVAFGMKGKLTTWYGIAVLWSMIMYYIGITSLW